MVSGTVTPGNAQRVPIGLCAYTFTYLWGGWKWPGAASYVNDKPKDAFWLIDLAAQAGLSGVEFPPSFLPDTSPNTIDRAKAALAEHDLFHVTDTGGTDSENLIGHIPIAKALGARALRTTLSGILEGDRRGKATAWGSFLRESVERLRKVKPIAEDYDMPIGLENHQDVTSEELLWICETLDSPYFGVTLDAANPMAVGEDPVSFTERIGPFLKDIHLKDYKVYTSESGFRLVRCPLGQGVMDWPRLFTVYDRFQPNGPRSIELGAMQARHIKLFEDDYWTDYPPRSAASLAPLLRTITRQASPAHDDFRTPLERGEPPEACERFELDQFNASVAYLQTLYAPMTTAH
jgi:sugar phosphate isomerase/epimerase